MTSVYAWIIDRLRWLCLGAAIIGVVLAYGGWSDASRIRDLEANGLEATAAIESATRTKRRRGGESYALKLTWRDAQGTVRTAERVTVSNEFARRMIRDDKIVLDRVRIKYLRDSTIDSEPIVLDDAGRQEEKDEFMLTVGLAMAGGGAVGFLLMFLLSGRRRRGDASPQAH
jgi:hypothetical protein